MSARGIDFLESWLEGNITEADKYGSHERANALAAKCMAEAKALGITAHDTGLEARDLERTIYETMHHGFDG